MRGVTLVELLVAIVILGIITGVNVVAFTNLRAPSESERIRVLCRTRQEAIRTGRPVRAAVFPRPPVTAYRPTSPLFLPDGRALGLGVDPLTGAPLDVSH